MKLLLNVTTSLSVSASHLFSGTTSGCLSWIERKNTGLVSFINTVSHSIANIKLKMAE